MTIRAERLDRFTTTASGISEISHPDPEIDKLIKENLEKAKQKEAKNEKD